ncbi:MAG: response regulator [Proteobacteria bacterium]|nr:response regulator [Pseudomonadota bacterium]
MDKKNKILIIDDEPDIRKLLRISFESQDYSVEEASSGSEGIKLIPLVQPSLIVLDLGLPDIDGMEVLKNIRSWSDIPIIILSVRDDEQSIITALDGGADDYLTKPFSVKELFARVRNIFRKKIDIPSTPFFESGSLKVDFISRIVTVKNIEIKLTSTEYNLLCTFIKHSGKILTHGQLLKEVWGGHSVEQNQYLRVYVGHLRQKIEDDPGRPKFLITEPGIGYRFKPQNE